MIYRFKSPATGDTLMAGPTGDAVLRLLGREPAPEGILEVEAMPAALERLRQAIAAEAASREAATDDANDGATEAVERDPISLRRRLWPLIQMIERAQAAREPIVWGV